MSDITGDAFVVYAAEELTNAIEHVGKTSSQEQIGKAIEIKDQTGVKIATNNAKADKFIGVVKAASGEAQVGFGSARMINDIVTGADPTVAPYFTGNVTIPAGKALTIERNCITYVFADETVPENATAEQREAIIIKAGDLIGCAANGKFKKVSAIADAVGRAYSSSNANGVIRAYIRAI